MLPESQIKKTKFSVIWLIPLIALITGIWMAYHHYSQKGIAIDIEFQNGQGIKEGKTPVKYAGIQIGFVEKISLADNDQSVLVRVVLNKEYKRFSKSGSLFWLVKPRFEVGNISGIDTIFTGQYITLRPGSGKFTQHFKALESPPPSSPDAPGLHILLETQDLGSIVPGSSLLYKKIKVGKIESYFLSEDKEKIFLKALISPKYSHLVKKDTRFWNASGISVEGNLSGIKIKTESIYSLIEGGVAFDTPQDSENSEYAVNNDTFILHGNQEKAMEQGFPIEIAFNSGEGLVPGVTPVKYKGITIGKVTNVNIEKKYGKIIAKVLLEEYAKPAAASSSKFWLVKPRLDFTGVSGLKTLISGQYIEVLPGEGSMQTKFNALDTPPFIYPESPGLHIIVKSDSAQSLSEGAPVYTKGLEAGRVEAFELSKDHVKISLYIYKKFKDQVFSNTRFWKSSGIMVEGGIPNLSIKTSGLQSLISGAVSFDTPAYKGSAAKSEDSFTLHPSQSQAFKTSRNIVLEAKKASGLQENITSVKYKGIEIGKISKIKYSKNFEKILISINLFEDAPEIEKHGTVFYVAKPFVSLNKVANIDTILTGSYIDVLAGKGRIKRSFKLNDSMPEIHPDLKGKKILLKAKDLNSLKISSCIFYKGAEAGIITGTKFNKNDNSFLIDLLIYEPFSNLIGNDTFFYNTSGININADLSGLKINTSSIKSIISGSIEFDNITKTNTEEKNSNTEYTLYKNRESAAENGFYISLKTNSLSNLQIGSPINYNGIKIGEIRTIKPNNNYTNIMLTAFVESHARELIKENSKFYVQGPLISLGEIKNPKAFITGSFIELYKGSGKILNEFNLCHGNAFELKKGLHLILESPKLGSLSKGKPIYYRQVKVGEVIDYDLKNTFDKVLIHILIEDKYKSAVRKNSKFWYTGGIATKINLSGVKIKTDTLQSIVNGGIAFATPDRMQEKAQEKNTFTLWEKPKEEWLEWNPVITD